MSKDPKMARNMMKLMRRYVQKHYPEASDHRMGREAIDELMEMRIEMLSKNGRILNANKKIDGINCSEGRFFHNFMLQ